MYYSERAIDLTPDQLEEIAELYYETDFPGRRPATLHFARLWVNKWLAWMRACHHTRVTYDNLQAYVTRLFKEYKPKTAQEYWITVRRFLRWLERTGRIKDGPHNAIRMPRVRIERTIDPITREEYVRLREASSGHWMDWIILLGWHTGMSVADCMLLRWRNVDFNHCCIRMSRIKTGTDAVIPFDPSDELGRALAARRDAVPNADPDDFVSEEAGSRARDGYDVGGSGSDNFRLIAQRAGLPKGKRFHSLRHSFVSMLANSGMSTILATKVSGHKDPRIFAKYVHVDTAALRQSVADARAKAGNLDEIRVEPHGQRYRSCDNYIWRPDRVYIVKQGRITLPDGTPVRFVKSGENAEGKSAVVTPCDEAGTPVSELRLVVDIRDVRSFV